MQVDYCYILSAGKGTRMGPIGEKLAKPLWNVFDKTLLELQIEFAKELGAQKIFINVHHLHQQVQSYIKQKKLPVEILYEPVLLDVGGAVHNLKRHLQPSCGSVLIINSDQFLFLGKQNISEMLQRLAAGESGVLATTSFKKEQGYNALDIKDNYIVNVIKNEQLQNNINYMTYTGVALIDLCKINLREGVTNFFHSVCHPSQGKFSVYDCTKMDYYDFGTLSRYNQQCFKLFKDLQSSCENKMITFLKRHNAIKTSEIKSNGYKSSKGILNFSEQEILNSPISKGIVISDPEGTIFEIDTEKT